MMIMITMMNIMMIKMMILLVCPNLSSCSFFIRRGRDRRHCVPHRLCQTYPHLSKPSNANDSDSLPPILGVPVCQRGVHCDSCTEDRPCRLQWEAFGYANDEPLVDCLGRAV